MSSQETRGPGVPWVSPYVFGTMDIANRTAFKLLNVIAIATMAVAIVLVASPFEGLLLSKGIQRISIDLNKWRIPPFISARYKNMTNGGMALYINGNTPNYTVGDVLMGDGTVNMPHHVIKRIVASYNETKKSVSPKFVNIYDFYHGAIISSRYVKDEKGDGYLVYDSSIYLLQVPSEKAPIVKTNIRDLLYDDLDYVYRTTFVGKYGKIMHEVKFFHAAIVEEIKIGNDVLLNKTEKPEITIRAVEVPQHKIIKIVVMPNSSNKVNIGNDFYLSTDGWDKPYLNEAGLTQLMQEKNIPQESTSQLFTLTRINLPGRLSVTIPDKTSEGVHVHAINEEVDNLVYTIIAGDLNNIIGRVATENIRLDANTTAVDRVIIGWRRSDATEYEGMHVCTKGDLIYEYVSLL